MIIEGTLQKIDAPHFSDNYNNKWQRLVVATAAGSIEGLKASKTPYDIVHDVNKVVKFELEQKQGKKGPYNKFTLPQDPRYAVPQPQQGPSQAAGRPNAPQGEDKAVGMVRHGVVCAAIQSMQIDCKTISDCNYWTEYIMTGKAPLPPQNQGFVPPTDYPQEHPPNDDIPF